MAAAFSETASAKTLLRLSPRLFASSSRIDSDSVSAFTVVRRFMHHDAIIAMLPIDWLVQHSGRVAAPEVGELEVLDVPVRVRDREEVTDARGVDPLAVLQVALLVDGPLE
jgi:hypothetical protein